MEVADIIKPKDLRAAISNQNNLVLSLWSTSVKQHAAKCVHTYVWNCEGFPVGRQDLFQRFTYIF